MLLLEVPHQNQKSAEKSFIFGSTRITTYLSSEAKKLGGKNRQSYVIEQMFRSRNKERNKKKETELYKKSRNLYKKKYTFNFFPSYIAAEKIICPP